MEAKKTDGVRFLGVNITHSPAAVVLWCVFLKNRNRFYQFGEF